MTFHLQIYFILYKICFTSFQKYPFSTHSRNFNVLSETWVYNKSEAWKLQYGSASYPENLGFKCRSERGLVNHSEVCHCFPQSLETNAGTVP